jgi:2'-5' RNA ligase
MRLFVAIDLPQQQKDEVRRLYTQLPGARWVPAEQLHLTLRFLGEVEEAGVPSIKKALGRVSFPPFALSLSGVGHFPAGRFPRVFWVGFAPAPELAQLYVSLERNLAEAGFLPEERKFSPHLTLARLHGTPAAAVDALEAAHRTFSCDPFTVTEFHLYQSVLKPGGAVHTSLATYPAERKLS